MSYATMDHARWVESNNHYANLAGKNRKRYKPAPEKLTQFQAKVIEICGMVGGGIYNAPINWERVNWGAPGSNGHHSGMFVPWRDGRMATFDSGALTMLVLLAHEARIRVEIRAKAWGHMELSFFQRGHDGGIAGRHPNIDEAIASFRRYLPEDHRIRYQMPADEVACG